MLKRARITISPIPSIRFKLLNEGVLAYSLHSKLRQIIFLNRLQLLVARSNTFAFNQSILDNIRYGRPQASRDEVVEAARAAQADRFIRELPQGYETTVLYYYESANFRDYLYSDFCANVVKNRQITFAIAAAIDSVSGLFNQIYTQLGHTSPRSLCTRF